MLCRGTLVWSRKWHEYQVIRPGALVRGKLEFDNALVIDFQVSFGKIVDPGLEVSIIVSFFNSIFYLISASKRYVVELLRLCW